MWGDKNRIWLRELRLVGNLICFGLETFVNFFEMRIGDVGVDLGGADVGVTKESLDGANVGTVH